MKGRVQYSASGLLFVVRSGGMGMEIERWQDLEVPPGSPDCQAALNRLSASVDSLGQKCLNNMESSFSTGGENIFYQVFARAFLECCHKRKMNKVRSWSLKTLLISAVGASGAGSVALGGFFALLNTLVSCRGKGDFDASALQLIIAIKEHWLLCLAIPAALIVMWFSLACFKGELARRNYRETWARNSVTYHMLLLAMIRFQSGMMGKDEFMNRVFEILEGNIEQFEYNITGKTRLIKNHENRKPSSG